MITATQTRVAAPVRPMWTLMLASAGAFLTALDIVIVAMALPALQNRLHASLAQLDWTINGYTLAFACLMLTGAAMGDRFGRRRVYIAGILLFTVGSGLAALSTSADALVAARLVQGTGAAVLTPLTLTLIVDAFPPSKRGAAIGIWAGVAGLGVAAAPLIGGAIVQGFAWQAIFWINVPIGLVLAALSARFLRESHGAPQRLDLVGVALAAVALLGLTWAPVRAPEAGWESVEVQGALAIGVAFVVAFIGWERRTDHPMLPLGFFRIRGFVVGNLVSFLQNLSLIGSLFMITQLLQIGLSHEPLAAGLRILPWNLTPMVISPIAGMLAGRFGNRPFLIGGMALQGVGLAWLTLAVQSGAGYGSMVLPLIVSGIGLSMGFPTIASAVTDSVPPAGAGVASGINRTIAQAAGLFGVAIVSVVFAAGGGYGSPESFVDGFVPAMWVASLVPVAGMIAAWFAPKE